MEIDDLRGLTDEDLVEELDGSRRELMNLRFRAATRQLENVRTVRKARRDVARIKTILADHIAEGKATIRDEGVAVTGLKVIHTADMQFDGQSHILAITISGVKRTSAATAFTLRSKTLSILVRQAPGSVVAAPSGPHGPRRARGAYLLDSR